MRDDEAKESVPLAPRSLDQALTEAIDGLNVQISFLHDLARGFGITGNTAVRDSLRRTAENIKFCSAHINEAYALHLVEDVRAAEQASRNLMTMALQTRAAAAKATKDRNQKQSKRKKLMK